ncbi:MAG: 2-hydroxyacyl-CoA dehydratase [Desulfohalobiaceae bacterium]
MSEEHKQMWAELGLDLEAHDALLDQVSQAYQDTFVAQRSRPEAMAYFDGLMCEIHGQRVRELMEQKQQGRKIVGAYCVFVPEEIVLAAGATLVGLCTGAEFAAEEVEKYLPRATCPMIKSMLGFKLGRVCPYLEASDLVVGEKTCDGKKKAYETMARFVPELYVMDLPQAKSERGQELFRTEAERFRHRMEELTGKRMEAPALKQAVRTVNARREAIHRLQRLRAADPAPISGLDALLANQVALYDDPLRLTATLHQVEASTVTEIKAHSSGVRELFPGAGTILDIGGQDSKAISLDRRGKVGKFEMNDRCAAGTGRFLEMMAASLGFRLEEFGDRALEADSEERINSMYAVFAESEVTSAIAGGADPGAIALGLHRAVIRRAAGMLKRVSTAPEVVFTGGVAGNPCLARLLREHLECGVHVPDNPQMTGALGAALLAAE